MDSNQPMPIWDHIDGSPLWRLDITGQLRCVVAQTNAGYIPYAVLGLAQTFGDPCDSLLAAKSIAIDLGIAKAKQLVTTACLVAAYNRMDE